jgi:hypothetical protein
MELARAGNGGSTGKEPVTTKVTKEHEEKQR